jgi:peptidoglycan lytic transglycosylase
MRSAASRTRSRKLSTINGDHLHNVRPPQLNTSSAGSCAAARRPSLSASIEAPHRFARGRIGGCCGRACISESVRNLNTFFVGGLAAAAILIVGWASAPAGAQQRQEESGIAAIQSDKGGRTTSGEAFNPKNLTAAHRSLPFGTMIRVTNTQNGRSIVVRINDRGPFTRGRVIDVTPAAARALGFSGIDL